MPIEQGDATQGLPEHWEGIRVAVTSPPYWGQRKYGDDEAELGFEEPREMYLKRLVRAFSNLREHMTDDAVNWVNLGSTRSKSGGAGGDYNKGGTKEGRPRWKQGDSGLPAMTDCNIPGTLADMMIADGWLLRANITWDKGRERREDLKHVRRPREASERILMFSVSRRYDFYPEQMTETGDVWHFAPSKEKESGQAPFPEDLPRRCFECTTKPGDKVADIFAGSGTTERVANQLGLEFCGLDLYA